MKVGTLFPSKFLKASDLEDKDYTLTIKRVVIEAVTEGGDEKPIIYFQKTEKGLVANKTNMQIISKALGTDETDEWIGKQITLYPTEVQFQSDMVPAIRVRSRAPKSAAAVPAPKPVPQDELKEDEIPF